MPHVDHEEIQRYRWEVGRRIRDLRHARDLTQMALADRAGLDHRTISRAENGRHAINIDIALRIARGLGVPPWRLFRDE